MIAQAKAGEFTCIVVKDLSRFGRNYSDAGSLIDNLFVQMSVRFISLAEGMDSYLNKIVNDILKNPIYTGDLVQSRCRVKSYKMYTAHCTKQHIKLD